MESKHLLLIAALAITWSCHPPTAQNPNIEPHTTFDVATVLPQGAGTLFIIGGGERPPHLLRDLLGRMRTPDGLIAVLPMASEEPDTAAWYTHRQFLELGHQHIKTFNLTLADTVGAKLDSVAAADMIYICGGDQNRFMEVAAHPAIRQKIKNAFTNGSVIAGTSAGAAVMSKTMITGGQQLEPEYESTYSRLMARNAVYTQGLGLLEHAIVDQHFIERSRYNRAVTALHDHPALPVFGIGEATALVLSSAGMEVVGDGQVVLFEPAALSADSLGRIGGRVVMQIFQGSKP
jgi:cyanophycinase